MIRYRILLMSKTPFGGTSISHSLAALSDVSSPLFVTLIMALWHLGHHSANIKTSPFIDNTHIFLELANIL